MHDMLLITITHYHHHIMARYYLAVLMTSWYASGVSYMMSVLMNPTNAIVSTVAFILILNNFVSGTAPPTNANDSGSSFRFASAGTKV